MNKIKEKFGLLGRVRIIKTDSKTGRILKITPWFHNLVVLSADHGKNLVAQRLANINNYSLNLDYGEIGTGTAAPAESNVALQTPVARAALALGSASSNVATMQYFFPDSQLPNGNYTEFGTFVGGSAALGSGQMFNRVLFAVAYSKASGEDSTIELQITVN